MAWAYMTVSLAIAGNALVAQALTTDEVLVTVWGADVNVGSLNECSFCGSADPQWTTKVLLGGKEATWTVTSENVNQPGWQGISSGVLLSAAVSAQDQLGVTLDVQEEGLYFPTSYCGLPLSK